MANGDTGRTKVGLYVDIANLMMNGGGGMRHDVLRDFACRLGGEAVRLNAYSTFDTERARTDWEYRDRRSAFHSVLRDQGYKVTEKAVKWYQDEAGEQTAKANVDLDLAVDALLQSDKLDRVVLATGDGDFVNVVRALQNKGCRVEVVAFDNVSSDLKRECDLFMSGYLIPNLRPVEGGDEGARWGQVGSIVRGVCTKYDAVKRFGFVRFLKSLDSDLWRTDTRLDDSPYESVFVHGTQLPNNLRPEDLPSRNIILEFRIVGNPQDPTKLQANEVLWVNP